MLVRQLANHLRIACSLSAKDYKPHYIPCPPFYRDEPLNIPTMSGYDYLQHVE